MLYTLKKMTRYLIKVHQSKGNNCWRGYWSDLYIYDRIDVNGSGYTHFTNCLADNQPNMYMCELGFSWMSKSMYTSLQFTSVNIVPPISHNDNWWCFICSFANHIYKIRTCKNGHKTCKIPWLVIDELFQFNIIKDNYW